MRHIPYGMNQLEFAVHKLRVISEIELTKNAMDVPHIAEAARVMREIARQYFEVFPLPSSSEKPCAKP